MCNLVILVVLDLEILIHQCFDLVRIVRPERQQAQVVAEELYCVAVFDDVRKLREERALLRIVDMLLERQHAFGLCQTEHLIQQGQKFQIVPLDVFRPPENGPEASQSLADQIGRASCRESVCQYVSITGVAVSLKKTTQNR